MGERLPSGTGTPPLDNAAVLRRRVMNKGNIKKVTLHTKKFDETTLLRPDDDFYPLAKYIRLFGDPSLPANRKRKHVVTKVGGVRGAVGSMVCFQTRRFEQCLGRSVSEWC